jgi:hypothetical protein
MIPLAPQHGITSRIIPLSEGRSPPSLLSPTNTLSLMIRRGGLLSANLPSLSYPKLRLAKQPNRVYDRLLSNGK